MLVTASATLFAGCFGYAPTPLARVSFGPAREFFAQRVIALPTACIAANVDCDTDYLRAVDAQVRMELEFRGHTVVDSETLNASTTAYTQRITMNSDTSTVRHQGANTGGENKRTTQLFADAAPEIQRAVLDDLMIDGWLTSRVDISGVTSRNNTRALQVTINFSRRQDGAAIWNSRCEVVSGLHLSQAVAMSRTMQCALESVYDAMQRTQPQGPS